MTIKELEDKLDKIILEFNDSNECILETIDFETEIIHKPTLADLGKSKIFLNNFKFKIKSQ